LHRGNDAAHDMADDGFDFELLARGGYSLQRFEPEQRIFTQDDDGNCMYVVRSGKVAIVSAGTVLETIGPNGSFGEMALIDGGTRSASAIAREPTEVAVIDEPAFLYLVERNPAFALDLLRRLTRRLRRTTESL
jgi:CRP-like cAMP-binding protein